MYPIGISMGLQKGKGWDMHTDGTPADLKMGIFSWFGWIMPLPRRLQLIKESGFEAVSVWWEDEIGQPGYPRGDMPALVRESGLTLENIHAPYDQVDNLWSENKVRREAIIDRYYKWLYECAQYQIPLMVMHIIDRAYPQKPNRWGIESLTRIVHKAEELGIRIAIENTGSADYIDFVLDEINSEYLGLCYDSSHDRLYSSQMGIVLLKQGHRLFTAHLSDNDGDFDQHWLPGEGIIDWQYLGSCFPVQHYKGCLSLEVQAKPIDLEQAPELFLRKAYHHLLVLKHIIYAGPTSKANLVDNK